MTLSAQIVGRLCVPCTPTELSVSLGSSEHTIRAMLHQLMRQGRVKQLDRYVSSTGGRRQRLWMADGSQDHIHELRIQECYERFLDHEAKWSELTAMVAARSPEQIAWMEAAKGLR